MVGNFHDDLAWSQIGYSKRSTITSTQHAETGGYY